MVKLEVYDLGVDFWIELIVQNGIVEKELVNLGLTCRYFARILQHPRVKQFCQDKKICYGLYDVAQYRSHTNYSLEWNCNSRRIAFGSGLYFSVWDVATSKIIFQQINAAPGYSIAWHPRDPKLLAVSHQNPYIWDIESRQCKQTLKVSSSLFAFHPDGEILALVTSKSILQFWSLLTEQCEKTLKGHTASVCCLKFTPNGRRLVSSAHDGTLRVWDSESGLQTKKILSTWVLTKFDIRPDNKTVITLPNCYDRIIIFDIESGCEKNKLNKFQFSENSSLLAVHPTKPLVVAGGSKGLEFWDYEKNRCLYAILNWVDALKISPDERALAYIGGDNQLFVKSLDKMMTPTHLKKKDDFTWTEIIVLALCCSVVLMLVLLIYLAVRYFL